MAKQKEVPSGPVAPTNLIYRKQQILRSDLFKLELSEFQKNVSWTDHPRYEPTEHTHFYHTIDSDGRKLTKSISVGGHFHEMEFFVDADGKPAAKCGPAMKEVRKIVNGRPQRVSVPARDDTHTHSVAYLGSQEIMPRVMNVEAVKVQTVDAQKASPIPGIESGE